MSYLTHGPMPYGGVIGFDITITDGNGVTHQHEYHSHISPGRGTIEVRVRQRHMPFPPPPPPESTQDRRKRLIGEVLDKARDAGQLGLTTDDQTNTVNALMAALSDEFEYDEEMGGEH